ncbi:MAG: 30S ribosomal protein S12 methylthiotransferase RimO [Clostridia bacterium]|nr:30S ribosomal protein S12 methylthiotransferase RimO [Clostridia bacterium]
MAAPLKIGFVSLGCPKNQIDTEVMLYELMEAGYEITGDETEADVVVINTCAFIESAKKEAIDNILDIAWLKKNRSLKYIIVCGCLAERYGEQIFDELPEVDAVLGVGSIHEIVKAVKALVKGKGRFFSRLDKESVKLGGDRIVVNPEYYAYIKIAEGCDNKCTYCAIPSIRGKFRSREMDDIVAEAKTLEEIGVHELCLVAQDTTRYGLDIYGEYSLAKLIRRLTDETSIDWIRVLYCYPDKITDELCEEFRTNPRLVKYIDLPIQHINDDVLRRMNRHGGKDAIISAVNKLREASPEIAIRTTAIVGFPGETDEQFTELCDFIKETRFTHFGAFTYSAEEDTPAAEFDDQIDEQVKQDRFDIIMELQSRIVEEENEKYVGKMLKVIVEGFDEVSEAYYGRASFDAPEIDGKIYFNGPERLVQGSFLTVKITETVDYDLFGTIVYGG